MVSSSTIVVAQAIAAPLATLTVLKLALRMHLLNASDQDENSSSSNNNASSNSNSTANEAKKDEGITSSTLVRYLQLFFDKAHVRQNRHAPEPYLIALFMLFLSAVRAVVSLFAGRWFHRRFVQQRLILSSPSSSSLYSSASSTLFASLTNSGTILSALSIFLVGSLIQLIISRAKTHLLGSVESSSKKNVMALVLRRKFANPYKLSPLAASVVLHESIMALAKACILTLESCGWFCGTMMCSPALTGTLLAVPSLFDWYLLESAVRGFSPRAAGVHMVRLAAFTQFVNVLPLSRGIARPHRHPFVVPHAAACHFTSTKLSRWAPLVAEAMRQARVLGSPGVTDAEREAFATHIMKKSGLTEPDHAAIRAALEAAAARRARRQQRASQQQQNRNRNNSGGGGGGVTTPSSASSDNDSATSGSGGGRVGGLSSSTSSSSAGVGGGRFNPEIELQNLDATVSAVNFLFAFDNGRSVTSRGGGGFSSSSSSSLGSSSLTSSSHLKKRVSEIVSKMGHTLLANGIVSFDAVTASLVAGVLDDGSSNTTSTSDSSGNASSSGNYYLSPSSSSSSTTGSGEHHASSFNSLLMLNSPMALSSSSSSSLPSQGGGDGSAMLQWASLVQASVSLYTCVAEVCKAAERLGPMLQDGDGENNSNSHNGDERGATTNNASAGGDEQNCVGCATLFAQGTKLVGKVTVNGTSTVCSGSSSPMAREGSIDGAPPAAAAAAASASYSSLSAASTPRKESQQFSSSSSPSSSAPQLTRITSSIAEINAPDTPNNRGMFSSSPTTGTAARGAAPTGGVSPPSSQQQQQHQQQQQQQRCAITSIPIHLYPGAGLLVAAETESVADVFVNSMLTTIPRAVTNSDSPTGCIEVVASEPLIVPGLPLADQLTFPRKFRDLETVGEWQLYQLLEAVGLQRLVEDDSDAWHMPTCSAAANEAVSAHCDIKLTMSQRQQLALARVLYRRPRYVVLSNVLFPADNELRPNIELLKKCIGALKQAGISVISVAPCSALASWETRCAVMACHFSGLYLASSGTNNNNNYNSTTAPASSSAARSRQKNDSSSDDLHHAGMSPSPYHGSSNSNLDEECTAAFGILQNPPPASATPIALPGQQRSKSVGPETFLVFSRVIARASMD